MTNTKNTAAPERSGKTADEAVARPVDSAVQHAIHNLKEFRAGRATFPGEAISILERAVAASSSAAPSDGKVPLSDPWVEAVRKADHFCPNGLSSPDRWRWKAEYLRAALATPSVQAVAAGQELTDADIFKAAQETGLYENRANGVSTNIGAFLQFARAIERHLTTPPTLAGDTKAWE